MRAMLREWISRLAGAFGRGRDDRDLNEELQGHLTLAEEEFRRQGMSPDAAAREARRRFGQSTQTIEVLRDRRAIPPLSTFWLDLKLGVRMLRKHWALTLIGGVALAAAMTVGVAAFSVVHALTGTSVPLDEGNRMVILQSFEPETQQQQNPTTLVFEHWRAEMRSVVDVGAFRNVAHELKKSSGFAGRVTVAEMSAAGFVLARIKPLMGRFLLAEDEAPSASPVVVIGYGVWQTTFAANPEIVGQNIQLDGVSHTIIGVMPSGFRFPVSHQYWTTLRARPSDRVTVFARLAPRATLATAQAELEAKGFGDPNAFSQAERRGRPAVRPYVIGLTGESSAGLAALLPFVLPLLIIPPCINIGALIYARTIARQGEFAARAALGASRARIIGQIFLEVLVFAAAAAAVALVLAPGVTQLMSNMMMSSDQPFWIDFGVSYGSILFTAGLALIAAYVAGAVPAMKATGRWQLSGLSALRGSSPRLGKAWTAIIVFQVGLSVAVLPIAVELAWSRLRPAILGPGFPVKEFLTARLDLARGAGPSPAALITSLSSEVSRQLVAEPGVTAVTASAHKPLAENENLRVLPDSPGSARKHVSVAFNRVDAQFFRVFGLRLLAGRGFEAVDNDPQRGTILVNRSFANRVFPGENPLGRGVRVLRRNGPTTRYEIVGLVDNQFANSDQPTIYRPLTPSADLQAVHLAMRMGPAMMAGFESRLREITTSVSPLLRVDDVEPLDEIYFFLSLPDEIVGSAPAFVALAVLVFAIVGIYTQMSFDVVHRRREIGIRSAMGAPPGSLVLGIFRSVFVPVLIGGVLGGLLAITLDFYLSPLLFSGSGGGPLPWILPATEAFIFLIGVVALFGPVLRTLRVEPTEALREG